MICTQILGSAKEMDLTGKRIVTLEMDCTDAYKKIQRRTADNGEEVGIRMGDEVTKKGICDGAVLYLDDEKALLVRIKESEAIYVTIEDRSPDTLLRAGYEIGNRHAQLYYGERPFEIVTPMDEPILRMLDHISGLSAQRCLYRLDPAKRIFSAVHHHHGASPDGHAE